jgi:hypothetical protein
MTFCHHVWRIGHIHSIHEGNRHIEIERPALIDCRP